MPTITETPIKAYAHCRNARCVGYAQEEVNGFQVEQSFTARDLGDNSNTPYAMMVERSTVSFRCDDEESAKCPACGVIREVTGVARPAYANVSGYDPNYLLSQSATFDPAK